MDATVLLELPEDRRAPYARTTIGQIQQYCAFRLVRALHLLQSRVEQRGLRNRDPAARRMGSLISPSVFREVPQDLLNPFGGLIYHPSQPQPPNAFLDIYLPAAEGVSDLF